MRGKMLIVYGLSVCYLLLIGYKALNFFPIQSSIFCSRDFFVMMMYPQWYVLFFLLPIIITTICFTKHDFLLMSVLQYRSWKSLVWKQQKTLWIQAVVYTLMFMGLCFFYTNHMKLSNWEQLGSYFYQKTQSVIEIGNVEFFCLIFVLCFIRNYIMMQIVILSIWKKGTPIYGVLCLCCIFGIEVVSIQYTLLFRLFTMDYIVWKEQSLRIRAVVGVVVYSVLILMSWYRVIKKKEWLRHETI